ncbi:MAG: DUF5808 domain-containing protein [Acidiferrobacterales bacterium]
MLQKTLKELWQDDRHWRFGIIYHCPEDPRVIVRNRFIFGWTWNFGHPRVIPTMLLFIMLGMGPALYAGSAGFAAPTVLAIFGVSLVFLVLVAYRISRRER